MRRIFSILSAAVLTATPNPAIAGQGAAPLPADVRYRLELQLHPAEHRLDGLATLEIPAGGARSALRLASHAEVLSVATDGRPVGFTFRNGRLVLSAGQSEAPATLTVRYRAAFNDPVPRDTVGIEDPSFGVSATILPEGTFLAEGVPWFPRLEGAGGSHRVTVSAPAGTVAITAGRFLGSTTENGRTVSEWASEQPMAGLALAAGPYQVASDRLDDLQLLTFLSAENAALAPGYLSAMRRHLAFYRDLLGPYPYPKFAVVENFLPTGYGLPSWTLLGKSVVRLPFIPETSLPHEIVHAWFGNAVAVDYARGNWAEGLATYLADYLLKERSDPAEALAYRRKILRDYAALVTPQIDFPLTAFTGRAARYQQAVGYGKGAMVFHMLRGVIGEAPFRAGLREMAATQHRGSLGWPDLERIFGRAAGRDLRWFFRQWVETTGAPGLAFADVGVTRSGRGWLVTGAVVRGAGTWRLDLPLRISGSAGETAERVLALDNTSTRFAIEVDFPPLRLEGDPENHLFRRLDPVELPATVNDLLAPRHPLVVVATGRERLAKAAGDLFKGLHWKHAEMVPEDALAADAIAGRDVLLLGWPAKQWLQPPLPAGLRIAADGRPAWHEAGQTTDGDTVFAVLSSRRDGQGLRALFHAQPEENARAAAAKISHYGRYSLLIFSAGRNLVKTTWEPAASPLKVDLTKEGVP